MKTTKKLSRTKTKITAKPDNSAAHGFKPSAAYLKALKAVAAICKKGKG